MPPRIGLECSVQARMNADRWQQPDIGLCGCSRGKGTATDLQAFLGFECPEPKLHNLYSLPTPKQCGRNDGNEGEAWSRKYMRACTMKGPESRARHARPGPTRTNGLASSSWQSGGRFHLGKQEAWHLLGCCSICGGKFVEAEVEAARRRDDIVNR